MGHSQAEKRQTHERIVNVAAKRFRERGIEGISIADIMKEVGATVGGFYRHFDSRDDLVTEAVSAAFGGWQRRVDAAASGGPSHGTVGPAHVNSRRPLARRCWRSGSAPHNGFPPSRQP